MSTREAGPLLLARALVGPPAVFEHVRRPGSDVRFALLLLGGIAFTGGVAATIQLLLLENAIDVMVDANMQAHLRAMQSGFVRLILLDRLMPPATHMVALVVCWALAADAATVRRGEWRALFAFLLVGLSPLLVLRVGELTATLVGAGSVATVGEVISLPRGFNTGPAALAPEPPPPWLAGLNARLNLFTFWTAFLWARAIGALDRSGRFWRHLAIAATALLLGGVTTWLWSPRVLQVVLQGW